MNQKYIALVEMANQHYEIREGHGTELNQLPIIRGRVYYEDGIVYSNRIRRRMIQGNVQIGSVELIAHKFADEIITERLRQRPSLRVLLPIKIDVSLTK